MIGTPAKFISWICECGKKLNKDLLCEKCKIQFKMENNFISKNK